MSKPRIAIHVPYLGILQHDMMTNTAVRFHRYMITDVYIEKDGTLYNIVDDAVSEDLYIQLNAAELMQYQEHLDGPLLCKDVAVNKYPELFV